MEPRRLRLRLRQFGVDARGLLRDGPIAPAETERRDDQNEAAGERELLAHLKRDFLLDLRALDAEEVDPDHRSPTFLSARPTATAAMGASRSASCTPSASGSNAIF